MNFTAKLNVTTTPLNYIGNDSAINDYINDSCQTTSPCLIPIEISVGSGGILELSNFNLTENINPVRISLSLIQDLNEIVLYPAYIGGTVQFDDIAFDFRGSKNITVIAHNGTYANSLNWTIYTKYSPFNLTLSGNDYFEVIYQERNESNAEPAGQNSSHGIFQITSQAYDGDIDIYTRYNNSPHACLTRQEFRGQNFTASSLTNTLNITNLTRFNQKLVESLNSTATANIFAFSMVNCSEYTFPFIPWEYFCFSSLCTDCVITADAQDSCEGVV